MSNLFTTVPNPPKKELLFADRTTVAIGSCFIENIMNSYAQLGLDIGVNPLGVLYNPLSIAQLLERALNKEYFSDKDIFSDGSIWRSYHCHSSLNREKKEDFLSNLNNNLETLLRKLSSAKLLCLTFGTSFFWKLNSSDLIVSNCQKQPGNLFSKQLATVSLLVETMKRVLSRLRNENPTIEIICTISPVRYEKGNPYYNSVSKGRLFQMVEELREEFNLHYFPAYEILLDELRDYRFYDSDLRHPSPLAIEIIQKRFLETFSSEKTQETIMTLQNIVTFLSHKDSGQNKEQYKERLTIFKGMLHDIENKLAIKIPLLTKRIAEKEQTLDNV